MPIHTVTSVNTSTTLPLSVNGDSWSTERSFIIPLCTIYSTIWDRSNLYHKHLLIIILSEFYHFYYTPYSMIIQSYYNKNFCCISFSYSTSAILHYHRVIFVLKLTRFCLHILFFLELDSITRKTIIIYSFLNVFCFFFISDNHPMSD